MGLAWMLPWGTSGSSESGMREECPEEKEGRVAEGERSWSQTSVVEEDERQPTYGVMVASLEQSGCGISGSYMQGINTDAYINAGSDL